jgi:hypothetical protein
VGERIQILSQGIIMTRPDFLDRGAMLFLQHRSRPVLISIALALVGVIGAVDYLSGFERSLLTFYLIPVALSAWFVGRGFAFLISLLSVVIVESVTLPTGAFAVMAFMPVNQPCPIV